MDKSDSIQETAGSRASSRDARHGKPSGWSRIPLRVWIFAVIVGVLLFGLFGFWGLYLFRGRFAAVEPTPSAIIWTATPSPTPDVSPAPTVTATVPEEEDTGSTPTPSSDISVGHYVKVSGTGGYGLSLREGPGPDYTRMDIAADEEVFIVVEGPRTAAGLPWWRIRDPDDAEREWWAVGNYLEPIEHP